MGDRKGKSELEKTRKRRRVFQSCLPGRPTLLLPPLLRSNYVYRRKYHPTHLLPVCYGVERKGTLKLQPCWTSRTARTLLVLYSKVRALSVLTEYSSYSYSISSSSSSYWGCCRLHQWATFRVCSCAVSTCCPLSHARKMKHQLQPRKGPAERVV